MIKTLEDINAECDVLFTQTSTLQEMADDYFDFVFLIKDDHIKKKILAQYQKEIDEWRKLYDSIVEDGICTLEETKGFSTMSKMIQQILQKAVDKEYVEIKKQSKEISNKLKMGLDVVDNAEDELLAELVENLPANIQDKNQPLYEQCKEKLLKVGQKIKGVQNEYVMVTKSLESKLEHSLLLEEIAEEFNTKCKTLSMLYYNEELGDSLKQLEDKMELFKQISTEFYSQMQEKIYTSEDIKRERRRCFELIEIMTDSPATATVLLQNKKNDLKAFIERDCGALITKTKLEMMRSSSSFEKLYSEMINEVYSQLNKPIKQKKEEGILEEKKKRLEELHEEYIKEFSPLYTFFCSGWAMTVVDELIANDMKKINEE